MLSIIPGLAGRGFVHEPGMYSKESWREKLRVEYGNKVCPQSTQPHCWSVVTWMTLGLLSCYLSSVCLYLYCPWLDDWVCLHCLKHQHLFWGLIWVLFDKHTHTHSELILIIKNILYLHICSPVKIYYNLKISTSNSVVICGHVWNGKKFGSSNAHIPSWGPCSSAFCSVLVLSKCPFCILLHDKCLAYVCFVLCAGDFTLSDGP